MNFFLAKWVSIKKERKIGGSQEQQYYLESKMN